MKHPCQQQSPTGGSTRQGDLQQISAVTVTSALKNPPDDQKNHHSQSRRHRSKRERNKQQDNCNHQHIAAGFTGLVQQRRRKTAIHGQQSFQSEYAADNHGQVPHLSMEKQQHQ
jgi:hypothetical protein